jgi:hypothetical protein
MIVIAPRMSPLAIIADVSSRGAQRTSAVSSTSGSPNSTSTSGAWVISAGVVR